MSDLTRLTVAELSAQLANGTISSVEITQAYLDRISDIDDSIHAYLHVSAEQALATARQADEHFAQGQSRHPLAGIPIAIKDGVVTRGIPTTAASRMLEGWIPPYDAFIVQQIKTAGMPILGKTNLDEFAMGSSTEHSAFGPTRNPWDTERIPGGSGGGSAAAVAAYQAPLAIGTDTGGSIRHPAAVTGTVGVKPTYGGVSRYGLIAMASSLDQAGPAARTVLDAAMLHHLIAGHDPRDATSLPDSPPDVVEAAHRGAGGDLRGIKVGLIAQLNGEGYAPGVRAAFEESIELLAAQGAQIVEVSCPAFDAALAAYYLIMSSEASSNLAKFDGMRFGLRVEPESGPVTAETVMAATRGAGFGPEVKRRIILGTYALSAGYYDAYYGSAQKVRTLIQRDMTAAFAQADVLVSPTSPTTAFRFGEKINDPLAMYLNDVTTIPANLAGIPAMSIPNGLEDGLPTGLQFMAPVKADALMYQVAATAEREIDAAHGGPILNQAPEVTR